MDQLALKHRPTFLYDDLKPALKNGLIGMTRPDAPRSPAQKYRPAGKRKCLLSEKGKATP